MEAGQRIDELVVWADLSGLLPGDYDAITGVQLDPKFVSNVRKKEVNFVAEELRAHNFDTIENCLKKAGKKLVLVNWVDPKRGLT